MRTVETDHHGVLVEEEIRKRLTLKPASQSMTIPPFFSLNESNSRS